MKKLVILTALFFLSVITFGQKLKKGTVIGTHVMTVELKPGVTMEQFQEFQLTRVIPEFEKHYKGWKLHLTKGLRGESKDSYGLLFIIKSQEMRDKYYDGNNPNELGKAANEKLNPIMEEANKLGKVKRKFTDWVVL